MPAVKSPNLPEQAGAVIIGQKYFESLTISLEKHGIKTLFVPDNCCVDSRLSGHADLSILHPGGKELWLAPYLKCSSFSDTLDSMGFELFYPDIRQSPLYPGDAQLNICICGKRAICNSSVVPNNIDEYFTNAGYEAINVRQGYARCSVCVVDENAVITADRGIGAAVRSADMDVLLISPGHIELPGYDYGFIGGASFKLSKDKMAFTGSLDAHPDKEKILAFLELHNIEPIFLTDKPAFDIGSAIPITEK